MDMPLEFDARAVCGTHFVAGISRDVLFSRLK